MYVWRWWVVVICQVNKKGSHKDARLSSLVFNILSHIAAFLKEYNQKCDVIDRVLLKEVNCSFFPPTHSKALRQMSCMRTLKSGSQTKRQPKASFAVSLICHRPPKTPQNGSGKIHIMKLKHVASARVCQLTFRWFKAEWRLIPVQGISLHNHKDICHHNTTIP